MHYGSKNAQLQEMQDQINELRRKMTDIRNAQTPEKVTNFELTSSGGEKVKLADLFGDKNELFVVHNMGARCRYCTLWADGFNGILPHLENRAAFVLSSPDAPEAQRKFAESRGWNFRMVSTQNSTFAKDLGYETAEGLRPGVSVFVKKGGDIFRVSDNEFGPGDDYCGLWHLFDLLPSGAGEWSPQYAYT